MSEVYDSIKRGLEEAIEHAKGKDTGAIVHHVKVPESDTAAIRAKTGLSQSEFAKSIGVAVRTLQGWEQGHRKPQGPARVLLAMLAKKPDIVQELLASDKYMYAKPLDNFKRSLGAATNAKSCET